MIKKTFFIIIFIFITSCGIPTYSYLGGAIISGSTFRIDLDSWPDTSSFILYSRYYLKNKDSSSSKFTDLTISDVSSNSEAYVESLGFIETTIHNLNDLVNSTELDLGLEGTFDILFSSDENLLCISKSDGIIYKLRFNDKDYPHFIGNYDDDNGSKYLDEFEDDSLSTVFIEFCVINIGKSFSNGTIQSIESLPKYINTFEIQTN
ncbi:hypothetical protein EW093_00315 [Thiospirochaeta perfilievii]|uniref:Uncharacterized protein n=1 Tax=Thiospirochaeta perfilievii TaxID=252967 RepID=A0A5C1Q770_9SPIO|nr:hypothetical protein [Thiospirochaeta perfilievii]QEN03208.1 hypothetical protein EW093_00315 [Thiospirochaeta perfilievii]